MVKIALFDYGAGNIFSLKHSLLRGGARIVDVTTRLLGLEEYDGLVLPGVGNFDSAISSMKEDISMLKLAIRDRLPVLGICLGLEMLFDNSEEGSLEGLKILDGNVLILPKKIVKVPHMGWNNLEIVQESKLLRNIPDNSWVYFVHSYYISPKDKTIITATSKYGRRLPVAIEKENLFGTQFHPEKSGSVGAKIIKNFLNVCENK
jgi:imidazole glycerol-phosphate synthase subunit HisH